jgi:hypothetical protein
MTLLVPDSVDAIVAGRQPEVLTMARAMQPFPLEWSQQSVVASNMASAVGE